MAEPIRVTCAPGCHFVVPHPSGLPGARSLTVTGGMTVTVSPERAERLWLARLILHPQTGDLPPVPQAMQDRPCPSVSVNRGPWQPLDGCVDWGPQPVLQPPSETAFRTLIPASPAPAVVLDAAGNPFSLS